MAVELAGEDRFECSALGVVGTAVNVHCERAVALRHDTRRRHRLHRVQPGNINRAVAALRDTNAEDDIAMALGRPRLRVREQTGAEQFAVAGFKVFPVDMPPLVAHLILQPRPLRPTGRFTFE